MHRRRCSGGSHYLSRVGLPQHSVIHALRAAGAFPDLYIQVGGIDKKFAMEILRDGLVHFDAMAHGELERCTYLELDVFEFLRLHQTD